MGKSAWRKDAHLLRRQRRIWLGDPNPLLCSKRKKKTFPTRDHHRRRHRRTSDRNVDREDAIQMVHLVEEELRLRLAHLLPGLRQAKAQCRRGAGVSCGGVAYLTSQHRPPFARSPAYLCLPLVIQVPQGHGDVARDHDHERRKRHALPGIPMKRGERCADQPSRRLPPDSSRQARRISPPRDCNCQDVRRPTG